MDHVYSFILDIIDTKLYVFKTATIKKRSPTKYFLPINFGNKALELIKISQILNHPDVIETLPCVAQNKENIPMVTYQLYNTVRKKIIKSQRNGRFYFCG